MEILSFYTCVPQMMIIWCMVPKISSTTNRIFCYFRLFFALLPPWEPGKSKFWKNEKNYWKYYHFKHQYHKWKSYDLGFLRHGAWQTKIFLILDHFLPFYTLLPSNNPENQNLKKMETKNLEILSFYLSVQ